MMLLEVDRVLLGDSALARRGGVEDVLHHVLVLTWGATGYKPRTDKVQGAHSPMGRSLRGRGEFLIFGGTERVKTEEGGIVGESRSVSATSIVLLLEEVGRKAGP
jgi:hypothetical protein